MEIVRRVHSMKETSRQNRSRGLRIGFVPTMGYLHDGHIALIRKMNELADVVVVSIFVNPAQFGPDEDFHSYPRDLAHDADLCIAEGVEYLFIPEADELYPPGPQAWVEVPDLSGQLEGASRPGHFRGVATVVLKLFHIVGPSIAAFGEKDAQQLLVVRRMVRDLCLDIEIVAVPTVRDPDGLALSSRNQHLDPEERTAAGAIPRALERARSMMLEERVSPERILEAVRDTVDEEPLLRIDYVQLVQPETLEPVSGSESEMRLVLAVYCGETRLIDNELLRR